MLLFSPTALLESRALFRSQFSFSLVLAYEVLLNLNIYLLRADERLLSFLFFPDILLPLLFSCCSPPSPCGCLAPSPT